MERGRESVTNLARTSAGMLSAWVGFFFVFLFFRGTPRLSQGLDVLDMFNSCAIFTSPLLSVPAFNFCAPPCNFNFVSTRRTTPISLERQYSNPIATFISANRSNLWLMHQSQAASVEWESEREIILCRAPLSNYSPLSLLVDHEFWWNFLCKCSTKSKATTTQTISSGHMPTIWCCTKQVRGRIDIKREREREAKKKSSYISNNFAVMAAHKKYAAKIIFHLRNQSIGVSHVPCPWPTLPGQGRDSSSRSSSSSWYRASVSKMRPRW